ncbi:MAG TPA: alpha-glucan family phosphorylase, partial [Acidimicrobiales bacterium]|nr:alpha-glucan family phosphorylase [Acidimicrobiales bacterium]
GHSALLALSLLRQRLGPDRREVHPDDLAAVRAQCVFTTHTPVAAGHDRFPLDLVRQVLGDEAVGLLEGAGCLADGELNMTGLGMCASHFVNAVSLRHQQVSQEMFPQFDVASITNGVHATTWTGPAVQGLFDHHVPGWRVDNTALRAVSAIGLDEIRQVHTEAKEQLVEAVARRSGVALDPDVLTIGVARRATPYKRTALLLTDPDRLVALAEKGGPVQVVYAGKAHPRDEAGKEIIGQVVEAARRLWRRVPVVYLEDYSLDLARLLCAGTDLWLNTPTKPYEASGTSGMKAALNGVPSLSVLDGWWIEGHVEGVTGWSVGNGDPETDDGEDASALYTKLEQEIVPLYYERPADYDAVRRAAISLNGSYFTTERMVRQYARRAYHRPI